MRRPQRTISTQEYLDGVYVEHHLGKSLLQIAVDEKVSIMRTWSLDNLRSRFPNIAGHEQLLAWSNIDPIEYRMYGRSLYPEQAIRLLASQSLEAWMNNG